jgi:hypothetical protein
MHNDLVRVWIFGASILAAGCGSQAQGDAVAGAEESSAGAALAIEDSSGNLQSCWGLYAIRSLANGRYVTTEVGTGDHGSRLTARAQQIGNWEKFWICDHPLGGRSIMSQLNFGYVTAEIFYGAPFDGMLRARADGPGPWEQFDLNINSNTSIRSRANGRFVTAEIFYGAPYTGLLRARSENANQWERFALVVAPAP